MNLYCKYTRIILLITLFFYLKVSSYGQVKPMSSSEILLGIQKLNTLGTALYVAAHPDDENTLLIGWLSKEKKVRTAYMALTRGDGGQNLIGPEQNEYVGLLRTHELMEARKVDGGEQYFSRAIDFGFTKKTDEALSTWGKEQILSDLVFRIRKFKPDVIINRFPPDDRAGHGHHSASAALSIEAFDAAADPNKFPDQLKTVEVWQAKRLVWNSYNRGFTNNEPDDKNYVKIPLGNYNPLLGKSYTEFSADARSKHRSQGFGSAPSRNQRIDYAINVKGDPAKIDLFDGIDLAWSRVKDGDKIKNSLEKIINDFDFVNPSKSTNALIEVHELIKAMPENQFKTKKLEECVQLIMACTGTYLEANAQAANVSAGDKLKIFVFGVNRSDQNIKLNQVKISGIINKDTTFNQILANNVAFENSIDLNIPADAPVTQPYWLKNAADKGIYVIDEDKHRGMAMAEGPLKANFNFEINGKSLDFSHDIAYKFTEPSRGEIYKYLEVRPKVMLNLDQKVFVFSDKKSKKVGVTIRSSKVNTEAIVSLQVPAGWAYSPAFIKVNFAEKNQEKKVQFDLTPPNYASDIEIKAIATIGSEIFNKSIKTVSYEHIPELNVFSECKAKASKINLSKKGSKIGYIAGAGDEVPDALKQIGYEVILLNEKSLTGNLQYLDAIMIGVRAYNTEDWLVNSQNLLLDYVKKGGNMIVQYQTQAFYGTVKTKQMGPFPITIGRGRVTDENAEMKILNLADPILNFPNKIGPQDFSGWVQERGLYFAEKWGPEYKTVFAIKDAGETEQEGSLLYAKYGKGNYVFTSLAFFRQLPAGVPGAFRLISNIIATGKK